jgi:acyl-coenzyme A synthetase/AMP-(fatty) acid ligase
MNIFLPIWRNGHAFPDRIALIVDGKPMTYQQLLRVTALASARLAEAGVSRGDCVGLSIVRPGPYVVTALAVARLGAIVAPFDIGWPSEQASAILTRHQIRTLVSDSKQEWRHPSLAEDRYLDAKDLVELPPVGAPIKVPGMALDVGGQPWIIALSSGTTGTPKSIPHTHDRALLYACLPTSYSAATDMTRVLMFGSPQVAMAMNTVLYQLVGGRTLVLTSDRTAQNFFTVVERDRPSHVATSTGTAIRVVAHAAQSVPDSLDKCASVRGMSIGGSAASSALRAQIAKYITPNLEINYGGSEQGRVAQANPETLALRPESAGRLRPWVEMQAVDENGKPVPSGMSGVLRIKSPLLVSGYLGDPDATARAFRDGWYYPGDTGSVDEAGYLTLTGRVDELLNLGGNKIDPFNIESTLDAQPGIQESVALAVESKDGRTVLVAVVIADAEVDEDSLRELCARRLGRHCAPARIVRVETIPRNAGGKIMRKEMAALLSRQAQGLGSANTLH